MKSLNYTIFSLVLIIALTLGGCAQVGGPGTFDCPDADNDGICNQYEKNGTLDGSLGGDTTPVECKRDDGSTVYLDCSLTVDCNCNDINDGEEKEMTEGCGWGCVSSNARTWVMVGTALLGAYIAGQYVHWPNFLFGEDSQGDAIEYPILGAVDFSLSYLKLERGTSDTNGFMIINVVGRCYKDQAELDSETNPPTKGFGCNLTTKFRVDPLPNITSANSNLAGGLMKYYLNLQKSPVKNDTEQYIQVEDSRYGKKYVKDPAWFGLAGVTDPFNEEINSSYIQVTDKVGTYFSGMNIYPDALGPNGTPTHFHVSELPTLTNVLFTTWKKQ